jgi:hypothetical protein
MLNLGGIAERITKIIQRIRKPIDEVIERIIKFISNKVKKLFGSKKNDKKARGHREEQEHEDPASKKGKKDKKTKAGKEDDDHKESKDKTKKDFDKDKGDEKTTDVDRKEHERFASQIINELTQQVKADTFEEVYKLKSEQARLLQQEYNLKLKNGIKSVITIEPLDKAKSSGDIDFEVDITPNNTKKKGKVKPLQYDINKLIAELKQGGSNIDISVNNFSDADKVLFGAFPKAQKRRGAGPKKEEKTAEQIFKYREERRKLKERATKSGKDQVIFHKDYLSHKKGEKDSDGNDLEGILLGHETVGTDSEHRTVVHINIDGYIIVEGETKYIGATIYIRK